MNGTRSRANRLLAVSAIFCGFGVAHLIDDFLHGVPAEARLSNEVSQVLALAFFTALAGLIGLAARGSPPSQFGLGLIGALLALADTLKHIPEILLPGPYRSGPFSVVFSLGLVITGILTALVSFAAWASTRAGSRGRPDPAEAP